MTSYILNYLLGLYISAFACFSLGVFVLFKAKEKRLKVIFFLVSLSISIWALFQALMALAPSKEMCVLLSKIEMIGVILIAPFFVHFIYILLNIPIPRFLWINYIINLFIIGLLPTSLIIKGASIRPPINIYYDPGILYIPLLIIYYFIEFAWGFYKLIQAYVHSTGYKRNQMKYFIFAAFIGIIGGSTNFLYDFNMELPVINPFGTYAVPVYTLITAYAIVKYRLMDISFVIRRTVIYAVIYSLAIGIFSMFVILFGQLAFYGKIDSRIIWMSMAALLVITAIVRPLDNFLTRVTDKLLFKKKYEYQNTLKAASEGMTREKSLPKLLNLIVRMLVSSVRVTHATVFLKDKEKPAFIAVASRGKNKVPKGFVRNSASSPLVLWLLKKKEPLVYDEILMELRREVNLSQNVRANQERIVKEMQDLNSAVCIPSFIENKLIGFLMLGEKLSGAMYTQEDLNLFVTLANNAAVAIENAQSYEELKDSRDQLLHSERLATIGKFANEVAHEIKNPLQAIRTFIEYLPERRNDTAFMNKFTAVTTSEIERIDSFVKELVGFSRPQLLELTPLNIIQLIENTLLLLENDIKKKSVTIKKIYAKKEIYFLADKNQLKQVFLNLFLNSLDAMKIRKANQLTIEIATEDNHLLIRITDSGCGIQTKDISHLFEPFFTTKENGSGLGLTIVKSIIENHKGTISVKSQPGKGTAFSITFPFLNKR